MTNWSWPAARLIRIIDGDTIDVEVTSDAGFNVRCVFPVRLRLARINAAPAHTTTGRAATTWLTGLLPPVFSCVTTGPYKYSGPSAAVGEWMSEITLPDHTNLSDAMVTAGHAIYWSGNGPRPDGSNQ